MCGRETTKVKETSRDNDNKLPRRPADRELNVYHTGCQLQCCQAADYRTDATQSRELPDWQTNLHRGGGTGVCFWVG